MSLPKCHLACAYLSQVKMRYINVKLRECFRIKGLHKSNRYCHATHLMKSAFRNIRRDQTKTHILEPDVISHHTCKDLESETSDATEALSSVKIRGQAVFNFDT